MSTEDGKLLLIILIILTSFCFVLSYWFKQKASSQSFLKARISNDENKINHFGGKIGKQESSLKFLEKIRLDIELKGIKITYERLIQIDILISLVLFISSYFATETLLLSVILSIASFYFVPNVIIGKMYSKQVSLFEKQLEAAVHQMIAILTTGQSIQQAIYSVQNFPSPLGDEFSRIAKNLDLNRSMEESFTFLEKRYPTKDITILVTGLVISRDVGPDVAVTVLESVIEKIRLRDQAKKEVETQTTLGRYTVLVVSALPFIILTYMFTANRQYIQPMLDNIIGQVLLVMSVILTIIGYLVAQKIVKSSSASEF